MPFVLTKDYLPVHQKDTSRESEDAEELIKHDFKDFSPQKNVPRTSLWFVWIHRFCWVLVPCLLLSNWYSWSKYRSRVPADEIFSPASSAIRYENVVFSAGIINDSTPYQGWPNEESNKLWDELYNLGVSKIPMSDAAQLANRTVPIPQEPGQYVIILSVFHQLHCLNYLRKRIFWKGPGNVDDDKTMTLRHMDHCIDSIRQSLMCSGDITPLPYVWWPEGNVIAPVTRAKHTCRDFSAIQEWARVRQAPVIDRHLRVDDPLGNVEFIPGQ